MLVLELLGSLSLRNETPPVPVSAQQKKSLGLLAILALAGRQGFPRDRIEAYLWPESSAPLAQHSLDQAVYAIRHALGSDFILSSGRELRLNPDLVQVDAWEFEEAIRARQWAAAVERYKGALLDGFHFTDSREAESWIDAERARLLREYQKAVEFLGKDAAEAGDHAQSVTWWRRLANSDPLSASATKQLMLALAAAGDRAGAVKHARLYQELVRQELEIEPDSEIEGLASTFSHPAITETVGTAARPRPPTIVPSPPSDTPISVLREGGLGETGLGDLSPRSPQAMLAELNLGVTPSGATTPHIGATKPRTSDRSERRGLVTAVGLALVLLTLASSSWYWYKHKQPVVAAVGADSLAAANGAIGSVAVIPFVNTGGNAKLPSLLRLRLTRHHLSRYSPLRILANPTTHISPTE